MTGLFLEDGIIFFFFGKLPTAADPSMKFNLVKFITKKYT